MLRFFRNNIGILLIFFGAMGLISMLLWQNGSQVLWYWENSILVCTSCVDSFWRYFSQSDHLIPLLFSSLMAIGVLWAIVFAIRQISTSFLLRQECRESVCNFSEHSPSAFTAGFFRPQVYISSGLKKLLKKEEYTAVLAHERYHQDHFHPLKYFVLHILERVFFFFPFLQDLVAHYKLKNEIAADNASVRATSRETVASALVKVSEKYHGCSFPGSVAGFSHFSGRAESLMKNQKPSLHWSRSSLAISFLSTMVFSFLGGIYLGNVGETQASGASESSVYVCENVSSEKDL